jgi:hypothetical protein
MRKWAVFHAESSPLIDFTRGGGEIKVRLAEIIMMRPGMGNRQNCKLSQVPIKQKIKLNYASRLRPTTLSSVAATAAALAAGEREMKF